MIIVIAVLLCLMGGCVVILGIIGANANKRQSNNYPANTNSLQRSPAQNPGISSNSSPGSGKTNYNATPIASDVFLASATKHVDATTPPAAKAAHVTGSVIVEMTVDEEGNVISATVTSGHPMLREAALTAARQWKFTPAKINGVPTKVVSSLSFNFN